MTDWSVMSGVLTLYLGGARFQCSKAECRERKVPIMTTQSAASTSGCVDRRAERRQAIIATASTLFAEIGYAECEMERVASHLGIAKGTLYLYFASKEELFYACVDLGMRTMQERVQGAARGVTDPFEKISCAIYAYLQFFAVHPEQVELLIQERAYFKNRKQPTYFQYRDANRGPWRELYGQLAQTGRIRSDLPVERILDTLGHLVYGTMFTNHFNGSTATLDEQHQATLEIVMCGILGENEFGKWKYQRPSVNSQA